MPADSGGSARTEPRPERSSPRAVAGRSGHTARHTTHVAAQSKVNWKRVGTFVGLTFGPSWLLDLILWLTVGYTSPAAVTLLQLQMLLPAFSAILLGLFVFKDSPIYFRANQERPRWFFYFFLKFIFRQNLHGILKDIYHMTNKIGFTAEYVENLSPAERDMYIKYYLDEKKEEEERRKNSKNSAGIPMGTSAIGE